MEKENREHVKSFGREKALEILRKKHGEKYEEYRKAFDQAGHNHVLSDFPLYIALEINSDCNLKCKMCLRSFDPKLNKIHEYMPMEMIDKIVDECRRFELPSILIGASAECTLHPNISAIISKLHSIGTVDFFVITNGLRLNEDLSKVIIENDVDRLEVSIDAATEETYRIVRGGDLKLLERNIDTFLRLRKNMNRKTPILRLSFCEMEENKNEIDIFLDKWKDKADIVDFQYFVDMSKVTKGLEKKEKRKIFCQDPFNRIYIDYKGDMYCCCCFGYCEHFRIGNIMNMTIEEAWKSDMINSLRDSFWNDEPTQVCLNCLENTTMI